MNFSLLHSFYVTIQKVSRGHSSILQRALISYSPMKVHSPETLSAPDKAARGTAVLLCKTAVRLKPDARQVLRPAGSARGGGADRPLFGAVRDFSYICGL